MRKSLPTLTLFAIGIAAAISCCPVTARGTNDVTLQTFSEYTPLAGNDVLAERLLSPLASMGLRQQAAASGKTLAGQAIDLRHETFAVYVPQVEPAAGYGALVFIPPWEDARVPPGWAAVLEKRGIIFVSAARSGNAASPLSRREPLAVLAAYNIAQRYHLDPRRIYVGGFSGGARVAMRVAVAYPDVFSGAFLDAGSDPVGTADFPLPSRALFERLRTSSHFVFLSGENDSLNDAQQGASLLSLKRRCVLNLAGETTLNQGHAVAETAPLAMAMAYLDTPAHVPSAQDQQCWTQLTATIDAELERAAAALGQHDQKAARTQLQSIDRRYSGLAAPRLTDLARANGEWAR